MPITNVAGIRHRQYLVLVLRYWCFGQYWYWYWYWKSQISKYWYWYWKTDSAGIGIGIGIDLEKHSFQKLQQISTRDIKTPIVTTKLSKSAKTGLICPYMDDLKQLWECHVVKSTLSIGIGIEVLAFWPVLVLVLVLKIPDFQVLVLVLTFCPSRVLVLVLTSGLSEVLVLVWPNWYCLCLIHRQESQINGTINKHLDHQKEKEYG